MTRARNLADLADSASVLDDVTATAAELNLLDGVTSTTAELNILDGVTSTAAELNSLDGITAVVGELNALDIGSTAIGTAVASKAVILDANKDYTGVRNLTVTGNIVVTGTVDGRDVAADGTTADAALPKAGGTISGTLGVTGVVTANAGVVVDNITIDGQEIDVSSGDLTLDVAGDIILDAAGGEVRFSDGSQQEFVIDMNDAATKTTLRTLVSDSDLVFEGNDGGVGFAALTLDMSEAGAATFNNDVNVGANFDVTGNAVIDGTALVTGVLTTTTATVFNGGFASNAGSTITENSGAALEIISTDTGAGGGPRIDWYRNPGQAGTDSDNLAQLNFFGLNDASEKTQYLYLFAEMADVADGSEDVRFGFGGIVGGVDSSLMTFSYGTQATGANPVMVFNEDSKDINFRVESDANANMLFVDAGEDQVRIGTSTDVPGHALVVQSTNDAGAIAIKGRASDDIGQIIFYENDASTTLARLDARTSVFNVQSVANVPLGLGTNTSTNVTVETNGDLTIENGNLVVGTAGKGIDFSATAGTGTSELLDDYEEGTWTPVDVNGVVGFTVYTALYTKVGRTVNFECGIALAATSRSNVFVIAGLPFTAKNGNDNTGGAGAPVGTSAGRTDLFLIDRNGTTIGAGTNLNVSVAISAYSGKQLKLNGWYVTDS